MNGLEQNRLSKEYISFREELDELKAQRKNRLRLAELAIARVIEGTAEREKELTDLIEIAEDRLKKLYTGKGTEDLDELKLNFRKTDQVSVTSMPQAIDFIHKNKAWELVTKLNVKELAKYENILPYGTITSTSKLKLTVHVKPRQTLEVKYE